jgi:MFS family permease
VTQPSLHKLTTPRAAALAGVVFAVLFGATLVLIRMKMPQDVADLAGWLQDERGAILTATVLMPFAGISFLWFIGAVRDNFGRYEDRFFATVFLGSGLLFLAMMFVAMAVAAALVASSEGVTDATAHTEVANFGTMIFLAAGQTYGIRMAAVFMISLATIWRKTGLMPGWLVGVSYVVALGLLIASDLSTWVTMAFPVWVLVVSGFILLRAGVFDSYRRSNTT